MAPSFDRRSFVNLHVCDCSVFAVGGGEHISLSQGAVKQIFFSLEEGTLSPALSCVNFQNQLIVQHLNNQMWDSHSKASFPTTLWMTFMKDRHENGSEKDGSCPPVTLWRSETGTDSQTDKKARNCWPTVSHQEPKPHDTAVSVLDHDHSLIDANECQIQM